MSTPRCAKMPVFGAMKPMRNSSAAGAGALNDAPISRMAVSSGMEIQDIARFMVVSLAFDSPANRSRAIVRVSRLARYHRQPRRRSLLAIGAIDVGGSCPRVIPPQPASVRFRLDAKVLRRLCKDRALFVDRLGELRWPTRVGNLGSYDMAVLDERIGVHHGPDVLGDALA